MTQATDQERGQTPWRSWTTVLGSFIGLMLSPSTMGILSFGVFSPYLREAFGWSIPQVAFGATLLAVATMIASPLQGLLIDRFGSRRLILLSAPAFGLGYTLFAFQTGELWQFYLLWVVLPFLGIGLWPGSYAKATASWYTKHLGFAVALATAGIGVGFAILPLLIGSLADTYGWRTAYLSIGLASAGVVWLATFLLTYERQVAPVSAGVAPPSPGLWPQLRRFVFLRLAIAFLLLGVTSALTAVHGVQILIENGETRQQAIAIQAAMGASLIAGRLLAGFLVDRTSVNFVMPACLILATVGMLALFSGATETAALCAAVLVGLYGGAEIDVMGYVSKTHFSLATYGSIYGLLYGLFQLGNAVGASLWARLRENTGVYGGSLLIATGMLCVIALLFLTMPKPAHKDPA